jgi:hypothetical protein
VGTPPPPPIDPTEAAKDPDKLVELAARGPSGAPALGAMHMTGEARIAVHEAGAEVESLTETTLVERDGDGAWHVRYGNSRDYGREAFFSPGTAGGGATLWIRPGTGKYHRRAPTSPTEPAKLFDETWGTLGAQLELVGGSLAVEDGGEAQVAGRAARRVRLALAPRPRPRAPETLPQRAWRDGITVQAIDGALALDAETGVILEGTLAARLTFVRDGHTYEMIVQARHVVDRWGGGVTITPPGEAESVVTPERSHELDERDELLKGLAPPGKRAAPPAETGR